MVFYIAFFGVTIFACIINDIFIKRKSLKLLILLFVCFAIFLLLGLKGENVGSDTASYKAVYLKAINGESLGHISTDYGYAAICKIFARLKLPYIVFSLFISFLEVAGVFVLCLVFSKYTAIFFSSFFAISQLQMLISAQRQSVACSFVFIAVSVYYLLKNKNTFLRIVSFYIFCIFAFLFHKSAIIAFIFPVLLNLKINLKHVLIFSTIIIFLCLFSSQISQLFTKMNLTVYENIYNNSVQTYAIFGSCVSIGLYFMLAWSPILCDEQSLISFSSSKRNIKKIFDANYYLKNSIITDKCFDLGFAYSKRFVVIGFIGAIFMSFSSFSGTMTRFAFFCFPLLYICLSNFLILFEKKEKIILYSFMLLFFFILFVWLFIYKDPLKCVPYYVEI